MPALRGDPFSVHTFLVVAVGFVPLVVTFILSPPPRRHATGLGFVALWLVVCAVNLSVGVLHAGYGLGEELARARCRLRLAGSRVVVVARPVHAATLGSPNTRCGKPKGR